jgi:hypothetical protein
VKLSLCLTKHYAIKTYGGVDVYIHILLTSALVGGEWSDSLPSRFTPGERAPCTCWIGGWVGPRACLDDVEKRKFLALPALEFRPFGRPGRSQSLYRLRYRDSHFKSISLQKKKKKSTGTENQISAQKICLNLIRIYHFKDKA